MEVVYCKVNKDQFDEFLKSYPRKLSPNFAAFCEPPILTYNDLEGKQLGVWPEMSVAYVSENIKGEKEYYIREGK